ncbi:MAG: hypothetical protein JXA41_07250 [Deltaproteobacteria bacterium]|nr:hypothetical protein [Deltaproteobacteria bacterium]
MAGIAIFRSHITTLILAFFFLLSACLFFTAGRDYSADYKKLQALKDKLHFITIQQKELRQKKRLMSRVESFVKRTTSWGLVKDRWTFYDVEIEEPMTFNKLEKILNQTLGTSSYFYKPTALHLNTNVQAYKKPDQNQQPERSADSTSVGEQDVIVKLKGAFLVQHR